MSHKTTLNVEGMTCSNCALGVTRFLEKKGLKDVRVDFSTGEVAFEEVSPSEIPEVVSGIRKLGYTVVSGDQEMNASVSGSFLSSLEFRFFVCTVLTIPLLLHMVVHTPLLHNPVFQLLLSIPVYIIGLGYFGKSAWSSLKTGIPNMDVLITTGSTAAFFYSIAGMVMHYGEPEAQNYMFFETTATIITLVMLGNIIEKRSVKRTTTALRELAAMQPSMANKISINKDLSETITSVPASEIRKDDAILINTGDSVPVDGKIYWGSVTLDESALTGESLPAEKEAGAMAFAGSIVLAGTAKMVTEKAKGQTVLANIIELVKEAQQSKPQIQKLGDKISAWFVPVVLIIAIGTFIFSYLVFDLTVTKSLMSAVAVLVISCPCAMGLATPTAVAVGLGKAAREGILVKGGSTLEMFSNIQTAVFDKTGTLTTGNFSITGLQANAISEQEAVNIIYSLEQHSSHPIARSMVQALENRKTAWIKFDSVEELRGMGITGRDPDGNVYLLGSGNNIPEEEREFTHSLYLLKNKKIVAFLDLSDEIKNSAAGLIRSIKALGITPVLLSGDNQARCNEVAGKLNIQQVYSGKLPHEKTEIIKNLKKKGRLLMVGDGINDAPSLASADIGISFGEATKIAINSAQVVILNGNDLSIIIKALRIGKLTMTTIKQNLFWAFAYNIVAIPIAAIGYLSPMVAAFSMAFSDVIVIGNSIRLKFRK
jgi:P-type Cu+ transporter